MTLEQLYAQLGGDYDTILRRLRQEERVAKFVRLFPKDTNYADLCGAMDREDWAAAFRAAHSLKGVSLNLAFDPLSRSASELTEALRSGAPTQDPAPLMDAVTRDYTATMEAIQAFLLSEN